MREEPLIKAEDKLQIENEKAKIIRPWIVLIFIGAAVSQGIDMMDLNNKVIVNKILEWIFLAPILVCAVASCFLKSKMISIKAGILFVLLRMYLGTFLGQRNEKNDSNSLDELLIEMIHLLALLITNHLLIEVFRHGCKLAVINSIIIIIGLVYRIFGFSNAAEHIVPIIGNCLIMLAGFIIIIRIQLQLLVLHEKTTQLASELQHEMWAIKKVSQEYAEMFQALEEAIVVIKDGKINFQNEIFQFILEQVGEHADETNPLDIKIFKIFRETDNNSSKSRPHTIYKNTATEKLYSLRDLIHRKHNYFSDKVFEIQFRGDEADQAFRFIQIKVSKIIQHEKTNEGQTERVNKILVQLIDVSDKMLYNEAKAEQQFVALINGAISHELRNPLNSIITEIM